MNIMAQVVLSILTDQHFFQVILPISAKRNKMALPVLRKDFIVDEYQVYESKF